MKQFLLLSIICLFFIQALPAQQNIDSLLPVRGFCIGAPKPKDVDAFTKFIIEELVPRKVNTLILRVDYGYQFKSHPELVDSASLSKVDVKKMVMPARKTIFKSSHR